MDTSDVQFLVVKINQVSCEFSKWTACFVFGIGVLPSP